MIGVKIRKRDGERVHRLLVAHGLFGRGFLPLQGEEWLIFPVREGVDTDALHSVLKGFGWELVQTEFKRSERKHRSLEETLKGKLPNHLLVKLPQSFDQIGDVVIVDFHPDLNEYLSVIAQGFLEAFPTIKAVYAKVGGVHGVTRVRSLKLLAGVDKDWVVHKEYGLRLWINFKQVYFSPRLSEEHRRVAKQVRDGEIVVDLFGGVGSFSLHISQLAQAKCYSVDINPVAIECLRKSKEHNKLRGEVIPVHADARIWVKQMPTNFADRVIMNHPSQAHEFLEEATRIIKPGGVLYFYTFARIKDWREHGLQILRDGLNATDWEVAEVLGARRVRQYSPSHHHVCLEVRVQKKG